MGKNFYSYLAGEQTAPKAADEKVVVSASEEPKKSAPRTDAKPSNYIAYMESQNGAKKKGFEELAEDVDLSDIGGIQTCFKAYLAENNPPGDILDILQEEQFKADEDDGIKRAYISFCFPGLESDDEVEAVKSYLEGFLEAIKTPENQTAVDVSFRDGANGTDCYIDISFKTGERPAEGDNHD